MALLVCVCAMVDPSPNAENDCSCHNMQQMETKKGQQTGTWEHSYKFYLVSRRSTWTKMYTDVGSSLLECHICVDITDFILQLVSQSVS